MLLVLPCSSALLVRSATRPFTAGQRNGPPPRVALNMHFSEAMGIVDPAALKSNDGICMTQPAWIKRSDDLRSRWRRSVRKDVLLFAGPALSTVLADPLMSVVDAVCCGRFCSTLQLASLGPSLAIFNFVTYGAVFLNAATTVLVTRSLACGDEQGAKQSLSTAVLLAACFGLLLTAGLVTFAAPLVAATGCVPELIPTAANYLRVRALGQPFVLTTMVVQSGLLAQRDALTPLQVVSAACALNVVGDLLWVPRLGAAGAAWATLVSQMVALPLMLLLSTVRKVALPKIELGTLSFDRES